MNGVISFVIFCDWLLLLSVCFLRFIRTAACTSASFVSPSQVLFISKTVFSLYPFMWPGERLSPHVSFSLRLLTAAVYQTPP